MARKLAHSRDSGAERSGDTSKELLNRRKYLQLAGAATAAVAAGSELSGLSTGQQELTELQTDFSEFTQ